MSHIGNEKDWNGLMKFYLCSRDHVPTLKRVTIAQWILASRKDDDGAPGTSELAVNAVNFCGLTYDERMEAFGAERYSYNGQDYSKFDDVEHFIDGFFYFISSGGYEKWHLLADRPFDFISHLLERGFSGYNFHYTADVKAIYDRLEADFGIDLPEVQVTRHMVSHGDYIYKIAEDYQVPLESVFALEWNGSIRYGSQIGNIHTGDLLYVLTEKVDDNKTDPIASLIPCDRPAGDCAGRTHFVLHQTVAGNLTRQSVIERFGGKRNKAHAYVLKSGEVVFLWPLTEKDVTGTKAEHPGTYRPVKGSFPAYAIRGKLIHIEIDYEKNGKPTEAQYNTLARLYIDACKTVDRILTIVPHIEVDRGILDGHNDPQNFDYNHFYSVIKNLGVNVERVPRFAHDRYWGRPNYKIPFDTDTFHFPPILTGNPHA